MWNNISLNSMFPYVFSIQFAEKYNKKDMKKITGINMFFKNFKILIIFFVEYLILYLIKNFETFR